MKYPFSICLSFLALTLLAHNDTHHMCDGNHAHDKTIHEDHHHEYGASSEDKEPHKGHHHEHGASCQDDVSHNDHHHEHERICKDEVTHEGHPHHHEQGASCGDNDTHTGHNHEHGASCGDNHAHGTMSVDVALDIQRVIGIKTQRVEKKVLSKTLPLHGRFEVNPDAQSVIVAPVAGRLKILKKTFDNIQRGDPLFTITSPELITRWNEIELLKARLQTYQNAKVANVELENQLKLKRCEWDAIVGEAMVDNGVLIVQSTINGRIEGRLVNDGTWCDLGAEILTIKEALPLRFKSLVPVADAQHLTDGCIVNYQGEHGILSLGMNAENGLMPLFVTFKNQPAKATPGAYALMECTLETTEKPQLVVPKTAVVRVGINPTVFIRDSHNPERFIAQTVTPGITKSQWIALEGLPSADVEVVVSGQYELKLALPSNKEEAVGHFHADGTFHTEEH